MSEPSSYWRHTHCEVQLHAPPNGTRYVWEVCGCEACANYRVRRELELQGVIGVCRDEPYRKS